MNSARPVYSIAGNEDIITADWYEEYGGKFDRMISAPDDVFTFISYKASDNQLLIRFVGHHPHATIYADPVGYSYTKDDIALGRNKETIAE